VVIAPTEHEAAPADIDAAELLIKEARRKARRRRLSIAIAVALTMALLFGLITAALRSAGSPSTATGRAKGHQIAATMSLPRGSRIWTLDMLNSVSGFAVAGASSAEHDERLIETGDSGRSWTVIGPLPYSYVADQFKPLLNFVTPTIGYTQTFREGTRWSSDNIYVTTNAGNSWSRLRFPGQVPSAINAIANASTSPDFRISNGVVSLISLRCTVATSNGPCPATLSEYRLGATTPFSSHRVAYLGAGSKGSSAATYLLAAQSPATALVAERVSQAGPLSLALTTDAGASWSLIPNPCKTYPGAPAVTISGISLIASRWILNCSQGTGMNHANVQLSETNNDGRSWSTINDSPALSTKPGGIIDEMAQVWTTKAGNVLWSYSTLGFVQVSINGGRTWSFIKVNGTTLNSSTYGGWPIEFDPVGPTDAYFVTNSGQILETRNGTNFTPVRLLHSTR
jgi:photosystem II stability/assembly factor-like uncharacterized protein